MTEWDSLEFHTPLNPYDRPLSGDDSRLDTFRRGAGELLVNYGIQVSIAEHDDEHSKKYGRYQIKAVHQNGSCTMCLDDGRLAGWLMGASDVADAFGPKIHEGLHWSPFEWPEFAPHRDDVVEVLIADCPASISEIFERGRDNKAERWFLVKRPGDFSPNAMTDAQLNVFLKGLSIGWWEGWGKGFRARVSAIDAATVVAQGFPACGPKPGDEPPIGRSKTAGR